MQKRRFRQVNLSDAAEIATLTSLSSDAIANRLFIDTDNDYIYYIAADGTPKVVLGGGGGGGANLSLGTVTATTMDVNSDSGTNATLIAATTSNAGLQTGSDKTKLDGIEANATTDQTDAEIRTAVENATDSNVFTDADHTKLDGIASGATVNSTDATLLNRANHTGTQLASTISNFDTEVSNNSSVTANTAKVSADGSIGTHSDVDLTGDATGDVLEYNGADYVPVRRILPYITAKNTTTTTTAIGATAKTLQLNTSINSGAGDWTLSTVNDDITILQGGTYDITYFASMNLGGTSRSAVQCRLQRWEGVSWNDFTGSYSNGYLRGYNAGSTCGGQATYTFAANDKVRITAIRDYGSTTAIYQEQYGTTLRLVCRDLS